MPPMGRIIVAVLLTVALSLSSVTVLSQSTVGAAHPGARSILDAHNCYPYEGRWADRIDRALKVKFPVAIEQDLAWYIDPATKLGQVMVTHEARTTGKEPTLREYFFEVVRPIADLDRHGSTPFVGARVDDDAPMEGMAEHLWAAFFANIRCFSDIHCCSKLADKADIGSASQYLRGGGGRARVIVRWRARVQHDLAGCC